MLQFDSLKNQKWSKLGAKLYLRPKKAFLYTFLKVEEPIRYCNGAFKTLKQLFIKSLSCTAEGGGGMCLTAYLPRQVVTKVEVEAIYF